MGNSVNKSEYFSWKELKNPDNEIVHYDPRFEDININNDKIVVSDYTNRIFQWTNDTKPKNSKNKNNLYNSKLTSFQYKKKAQNIGRAFDELGLTLCWCDGVILYCYDIKNGKLYSYDLTKYLLDKYNSDKKDVYIPEKQIINIGKGIIWILICYAQTKNRNDPKSNKKYDLTKFDIINKKSIKAVTIVSKLFTQLQYKLVYWGFCLNNGNKNTVSILANNKGNKLKNVSNMYVLYVSLNNGSIIWRARFDYVHDLRFNDDGKYLSIFERPRNDKYGYIHVLNLARLKWLCQLKLLYGGVAFGWDGIAWLNDSLVFVSPYHMSILTPNDNEFRVTKILKKNDELIKKINEKKNNDEDNNNNNNNEPESKIDEIDIANKPQKYTPTPEEFIKRANEIKTKKISVLGIGKRWWDCEKDIEQQLTKQWLDSNKNISRIILEFAGLSWAILKFDYPLYKQKPKSKDTIDIMAHLQGAMSEVFESGVVNNKNVLILSRIARDPDKGILNNWIFQICHVPINFVDMWLYCKKYPSILSSGVITQHSDAQDDKNKGDNNNDISNKKE